MENDTIRPSGGNTLVDIWIDGRMRAICVLRGAIEAYAGSSAAQSAPMSDEQRCEFVRSNLGLIMKVAKSQLRQDPSADTITVDIGQLHGEPGRGGDRRKGERRKINRPDKIPLSGERRRGERRKGDRRSRAPDKDKS